MASFTCLWCTEKSAGRRARTKAGAGVGARARAGAGAEAGARAEGSAREARLGMGLRKPGQSTEEKSPSHPRCRSLNHDEVVGRRRQHWVVTCEYVRRHVALVKHLPP